ncbi:MAG: DUF2752 domain-containing protein [Oscillospiraceae bacterium]|nr:DUF2752 domain-containing protein [Oscillospiraceae bacterium]
MKRKEKWLGKLAVSAAVILGVLLFRKTDIGCVYRRLFGIPCPGCGMGRAIDALLRLDFAAAWRWHPMVFSLPVLAVYLLKDGPLFRNRRWDTALLIAIGVGFLIRYVFIWQNTNLLF